MHREPLLALLQRYGAENPDEHECVSRIRSLVAANPNCFERSCMPGHITASVWIASADRKRFLLTHHKKLNRWLQLGGHADGDPDVRAVALRESREESGMEFFDFIPALDPSLIDVDVHRIPAFGREPAHDHHDLRFLLIARPDQPIEVSDESHDVAWFELARLEERITESSLLRLARKSRAVLKALDVEPSNRSGRAR
jgi:8-oxo-dGTP pyrophosphatase MutT (NUDIX family)